VVQLEVGGEPLHLLHRAHTTMGKGFPIFTYSVLVVTVSFRLQHIHHMQTLMGRAWCGMWATYYIHSPLCCYQPGRATANSRASQALYGVVRECQVSRSSPVSPVCDRSTSKSREWRKFHLSWGTGLRVQV